MKCWLTALVFFIVCGGLVAEDTGSNNASRLSGETNCTVITSTRLNYDQAKRVAVFEENVIVIDPELNINADRLTVFFAEDNKVATIEANGNVVIEQNETKGFAQKAVYAVKEGKVVLTGSPEVHRGSDELSGETITFWRYSGRILCEPRAMLKLYSDEIMP